MNHPVLFDCDPGIDDAAALVLVLAYLDVRMITTCAGNQLPIKTYTNARNLLSLMGREEIPVYQGAPKPLVRELRIAAEVHGKSGVGPVELPESTAPHTTKTALEASARFLSESEQPVEILATGPLTNIAILLVAHPELKHKIKGITLMGGAFHGGNTTPVAEFNMAVDPEAANLVFRSGVPIVMFGLDVTRQAQCYREDIERLREVGTKTATALAAMLDFYSNTLQLPVLAPPEHVEGVHLHDPCAAAYLVDPSLFTLVRCNVEIETKGEFTAGCTVVDYYHNTGREENASVAFAVNREKLIDLLCDAAGKLS